MSDIRAIKLMADYDCFPLWGVAADDIGDIDPSSLPISKELTEDLLGWADGYDGILNRDDPAASGFSSPKAKQKFERTGSALAVRLREELGDQYVVIEHIG